MSKRGEANRAIRRATQEAVRQTAAEIMNGLAEAGPHWSGNFRDSWVADAKGAGGGVGRKASYPYSVQDVAKLQDTIAATKKPVKLTIENRSPYALYAMDLLEGKFRAIGSPKGATSRGTRNLNQDGEGIRGDLSGGGSDGETTNLTTAPKDWFMTYLQGGSLQKRTEKGINIGFRRYFR